MDGKKSPGRDKDFDVLTAWGAGVPGTDEVDAPGPSGDLADRASAARQLDPAVGLSVLHVVVQAGPTNSQYNEHCLPVMRDRRITVCSLFPADVVVPREITLVQGDGSVRGCFRALREALALATYDVVHVHAAGSGILALAVYLLSGRSRRDLVFTLHTSWPNVRLRNRLFLYVVAGLFPVFVACGEASAASLPRTLRRLVRRLEVVPNGVDVERIDQVLEGEVVPAPPTGRAGLVVSVGRLIGIKDPATVVAAFRRAARPEDQLVMVGDGELLPSLELDARRLPGDGGVFFTGLVPREEVHETLHCADLFVSASTVEGLPVAVLEAMVCRCLVVLSDIPAHREIASRTSGVELVAPGDVAGFADAIGRIADLSPEARLRAGEELRSCAVQHYSVRAMSQAYGRIYQSIVRDRAVRRSRRTVREVVTQPSVRRAAYVGTCALLGAAAAFGYGRLHPQTYQADVTLEVGDASAPLTDEVILDGTGSAADLAGLLDHQPVLAPVARQLGVRDWRSLRGRVESTTGSEDPRLVVVSASGSSPDQAERLLDAVTERVLALTTDAAAAAADPEFAEREIERIPTEIAAADQRLTALLAETPGVGAEEAARERAVVDLRQMLAGLHAGQQGLLEWRSEGRQTHGVTITDRTAGRPAPELPEPPVLALAGGAAGACLWLAGWLLFRRDAAEEGGRP